MIGKDAVGENAQGCQCQEGADSGENGSQIDARALPKRSDDEHFSRLRCCGTLEFFQR